MTLNLKRTTVMTPEEIHLGLYKRNQGESRGEAQIAPRQLRLSHDAVIAEVRQIVTTAEFILKTNEEQNLNDTIELQCTTLEVEKAVRKQLGKKAKAIRFMPPKVQDIRGQYQYGK